MAVYTCQVKVVFCLESICIVSVPVTKRTSVQMILVKVGSPWEMVFPFQMNVLITDICWG